MMPRIASKIAYIGRLFVGSTGGIAAVEFAMIIPGLLIMLLATFDAGRAISIYIKVRSATYTLAAVANQYTTIQATDMSSIVGATSVVLSPYSSTPVVVTISQLSMNNAGAAVVNWSYSLNGTARTQGASVTPPSNFLPANNTTCNAYPCYLMLAEVAYSFTPLFSYFSIGSISLSDNLYVTPRRSNCVLYPPANVTTC